MLPGMNAQQPIPFRPDVNARHAANMRSLTRAMIAIASRTFEIDPHTSARPSVESVLKRKGWKDDRLAATLTRAVSTPATTAATGWAIELTQAAQALLAALIPQSAGAQFLDAGHNLSFDGAATVMMPSLSGGAATWIAENAAIRVINFLSAAPTLSPHKVAAICVLTQEMISSGNAETIVRQALVDACASAIDSALLSTTAASSAQPGGLLVGATGVAASTVSDLLDAMGSDLANLVQAIAPYAGNGSVMFAAAPQQAVRAALFTNSPYPVLMSAALSPGSVICAATNALASIIEPPTIEIGFDASLHMEDSTPLTPASSPSKSMPQIGGVALKIRLPITWAARDARAVSYLTGTTKW
jgi:hypothetical protein